MKVLALMLLLVAVTAAQFHGGPSTNDDTPPSGGLMSAQIGGRSVQNEDRFGIGGIVISQCQLCKAYSDLDGWSEGCKDECN